MVIIQNKIVGGQQVLNKTKIKETILGFYSRIKKCALWILLEIVPTYLMDMLLDYIKWEQQLRRSLRLSPKVLDAERQVYDLANCGKNNRFMVGNLIVHNCNYGAGPQKIQRTLRTNGVDLDLDIVQGMHATYWEIHGGIRRWGDQLFREWRRNGGYVLNGIGRPVAVAEDYVKDLPNRVVQSTGHDCLLIYIEFVKQELARAGIEWYPIVMDFHDESIIEVREDQAELAKDILQNRCYELLNQYLGGKLLLRGAGAIGYNLADIKLEE